MIRLSQRGAIQIFPESCGEKLAVFLVGDLEKTKRVLDGWERVNKRESSSSLYPFECIQEFLAALTNYCQHITIWRPPFVVNGFCKVLFGKRDFALKRSDKLIVHGCASFAA